MSAESTVPLKSNEALRGATMSIHLKGLPIKIKYVHFKRSLPVQPKNIDLSSKSGQRSALLTFNSEEECSKAFDALQNFTYEDRKVGHKT